jgi:uncharacterized protein (DUF1330 family)
MTKQLTAFLAFASIVVVLSSCKTMSNETDAQERWVFYFLEQSADTAVSFPIENAQSLSVKTDLSPSDKGLVKSIWVDSNPIVGIEDVPVELFEAAALVNPTLYPDFSFEADKFYTLARVWITDYEKYNRYIKGTDAARTRLGAKIVFKEKPAQYVQSNSNGDAPSYLIVVEWSTEEGPFEYMRSEEFRQYATSLGNLGLANIHWYLLK